MVSNQHFYSGTRNYAIGQAYEFIDNTFPKDAIIQHNPDSVIDYCGYSIPFGFYNGLYGNRKLILPMKVKPVDLLGNYQIYRKPPLQYLLFFPLKRRMFIALPLSVKI